MNRLYESIPLEIVSFYTFWKKSAVSLPPPTAFGWCSCLDVLYVRAVSTSGPAQSLRPVLNFKGFISTSQPGMPITLLWWHYLEKYFLYQHIHFWRCQAGWWLILPGVSQGFQCLPWHRCIPCCLIPWNIQQPPRQQKPKDQPWTSLSPGIFQNLI